MRERQKERKREREKERKTEKEREREKDKKRKRERKRERERERERKREREKQIERERVGGSIEKKTHQQEGDASPLSCAGCGPKARGSAKMGTTRLPTPRIAGLRATHSSHSEGRVPKYNQCGHASITHPTHAQHASNTHMRTLTHTAFGVSSCRG